MTEQPEAAEPSEKNTTGEVDPSKWQEAQAVTGRPVDVAGENSTFASRRAQRTDAAKVDTPVAPKSRKKR